MSAAGWKIWALSAVFIVFSSLLAMVQQRGRQIEILEMELRAVKGDLTLREETVTRLKAALAAAGRASAAQGIIQKNDIERREHISQITREAKAEPKPGAAVDDQTSRRAIEILNNDLFAPFDDGLRGPGAGPPAGPTGGAMPGPARAGLPAAEP